jgi:uncharacterized protein DUF2752
MAVLSGSRSTAPGRWQSESAWRLPPALTTGLAAASLLALGAARLLDPANAAQGPVICPFRLLTGLPCPGCGMTRAWVYLTHGDVAAAVSANPFALVALPAALLLVGATALSLVRRQPPPDVGRALRTRAVQLVLAGWVLFGVVRAVVVLTGHASA